MNSNEILRWVKAFFLVAIIFLLVFSYVAFRQGSQTLSTFNKSFASTATIVAGLTLVIGPLSKKFISLTKLMTIRRQLGLLAFGVILGHVGIVLGSLSADEWIPLSFGAMALLTWCYMVFISRDSVVLQMGPAVWKKRLSFAGFLAFGVIFIHVILLQNQAWLRWFHGAKKTAQLLHPNLAPISFFVFLLMCGVIVYRIFIHFKYGNKK